MSDEEREERARERALAAFEEWCPHVVGNPFIPHWPTAKQQRLLGMHLLPRPEDQPICEALFGGAAGGGKSDALLMAAAQFAWQHPEFHGILFRRTHTDLAQPGALMDRALEWWIPEGVAWDGTNKIFRFPSGAKVALAYLKGPQDHLRYQSAEYHLTGWDELTQWPDDLQYRYVGLSRVRRGSGSVIPLRTFGATNPGGPGHIWVKNRFLGGIDPVSGEFVAPIRPYLPARIQDNPHLDQEAYIQTLMHLHPTVREQLLNGDWSAREPGDYFRREWFGPMLDPEADAVPLREKIVVRWWDLAASEKEDACYTAGVRMARLTGGVRAIEHAISFRKTPGARDDAILQTAQGDGHHVYVGIEIEGGSGGPAQFEALAKRLGAKGFRVVGARPKAELSRAEAKTLVRLPSSDNAKAARADPVSSCLERGYQRRGEGPDTGGGWWGEDIGRDLLQQRDGIRIYAGPWTHYFLDRLEGFPETGLDEGDALSGAWSFLEAHPLGSRVPPAETQKRVPAELQNVHPADRPPVTAGGKDRAGRWRP